MPETGSQTGPFRQRRRTRAAIVNAMAELLRSGRTTPGVSEIAEAADVSRRAVYHYFYFPTVDQLRAVIAGRGHTGAVPYDPAIYLGSAEGTFWDWPGDTEVIMARKRLGHAGTGMSAPGSAGD